LPFDVKVPNAKTVAAIKEARTGKLPSFRNVADLMADLNADD
jgi:DNA-damage-inducible protein J